MQKRLLIIAHDAVLRSTRSTLLLNAGFAVSAVGSVDEAIQMLQRDFFDLVIIGRTSISPVIALDQRLRELYPQLLLLKIAQSGEPATPYPTRTIGSDPSSVLATVKLMLGPSDR